MIIVIRNVPTFPFHCVSLYNIIYVLPLHLIDETAYNTDENENGAENNNNNNNNNHDDVLEEKTYAWGEVILSRVKRQ